MLQNLCACFWFYARCATVDYAVKEPRLVCCKRIVEQTETHSIRVLLTFYAESETASSSTEHLSTSIEWCSMYDQHFVSNALIESGEATSLTALTQRPYAAALTALRYWQEAGQMFYVQTAVDADGAVVLCAVQMAPAQQPIQRSVASMESSDEDDPDYYFNSANSSSDSDDNVTSADERTTLLRGKRMAINPPFLYTIRFGKIYWIPVIFSCDKAPRWPPKHRHCAIVQHRTLLQLRTYC